MKESAADRWKRRALKLKDVNLELRIALAASEARVCELRKIARLPGGEHQVADVQVKAGVTGYDEDHECSIG